MTTVLSLASMSIVIVADALYDRLTGDAKVEKARALGEAGLGYFAEEWRAHTSYLDYVDGANGAPADGVATTADESPAIGNAHELGGGTFTLIAIQDKAIAASTSGAKAKLVRVRSTFDGVRFTWEALLAPNLIGPIQGVATTLAQRWQNGATFDALGGGRGTIFGNSTARFSGTGTVVKGDVSMAAGVDVDAPAVVDGTIVENAAPVGFPDVAAIIGATVTAATEQPASYWGDAAADLELDHFAVHETIAGSASSLGPGWSDTNTPYLTHLFVRGGSSSLPAGNYVFGRLWLDAAVLTIKAPPGGGTLVLPDLYLTNGARLVLDASEGPFTVVGGFNHVFENPIGGTAALEIDGDLWNKHAGEEGTAAADEMVKPLRGSTTGSGSSHDDWQIVDGSILAVVTASPSAKGLEMYMPQDADLVLANGGSIRPGLDPSNLKHLANEHAPPAVLDKMETNAPGFIAWSVGGSHPRIDIATGANAGEYPASFTGLTYGGFKAVIGSLGTFTGAFVGQTMTIEGAFHYDSRLADLLIDAEPGSEHAVVKYRVDG